MKILFASANYGEKIIGGAQLSIRLVAERFAQDGHDVAVVFVDPFSTKSRAPQGGISLFPVSPKNIYWHQAPRKGAPTRMLWHINDRFNMSLKSEFGRVIDEFSPDVLHSNVLCGLTTAIWLAAKEKKVPIVHTVHDYYLLCAKSGMRTRSKNCAQPCRICRVFSAPSKRASRLVSQAIYVSQHMRAAHEANDVFKHLAPGKEIIGSYRRELPVLPGTRQVRRPLRLGYLGRIAPDKGIDRLLTELQRVASERYELRIAGTGASAYVEYLKTLSAGMPIKFLGRVTPDTFLDSIDLLVVPSLWNEPAGRVVFEAGLSRVPVIVSNRGGLPQMVDYGTRGWIYDPDLVGDLATVIKRVLDSPAEVGEKIERWRDAANVFAPDYVAEQTLRIYRDALAG